MACETPGTPAPGDVQLSVVVPVYGCADCLIALYDRLTSSVSQVTDRYELVFVDDRSVDGGWDVLRRLAGGDARVRAFRLSRNFGQDAAITAGLAQARGEWAVVMDCDLQEAPEDIPRLWAAAGDGYDVVRSTRRGWRHSAFRRWTSRAYRKLTLETDVRPDYSNLSLLSRRVIDAFLRLGDRDREYMIALDWLGFDSTAIEIEHHERHSGKSGYTFQRLVRVALDGMFFRSTVLLRVVVLVGFLVASAGIVLAGFEVVDYFVEPHQTIPGYTSLAVLLLLLAGFIIVSVGVVGLYVGRIFEQVKNRPLFLIDARAEGPANAWSGPVVTSAAAPSGGTVGAIVESLEDDPGARPAAEPRRSSRRRGGR
ncbi:MAG: glycosyltransferase family 2 protein [Solirubrobacteraceae bacterium]